MESANGGTLFLDEIGEMLLRSLRQRGGQRSGVRSTDPACMSGPEEDIFPLKHLHGEEDRR